MRLLIMDGTKVANVIEVDPTAIPPEFADAPVAPDGVGVGSVWNGTDYDPPAVPAITNEDVNAERDRRVEAGATFTLAGYGDVRSLGRAIDKTNLQALGFAASLRVASGDTTTITRFRDADDEVHDLTPPQVLDLWSQASGYVEAVFQASWALKDDPDGIPLDYATNEDHWP